MKAIKIIPYTILIIYNTCTCIKMLVVVNITVLSCRRVDYRSVEK